MKTDNAHAATPNARVEVERNLRSAAHGACHFTNANNKPKPDKTMKTFGEALEALKQGKRIARSGWNGKNMFLFLLPASDGIPTSAIHDPALREVIESEVGGDTFDALGSIRMFTADKKILTGWLASQSDMLSEDWEVLN